MYYLHQLLLFIKLCIFLTFFSSHFRCIVSQTTVRIRLCVPDSVYDYCVRMSDNVPGTFSCVNARDKYECMKLIDRDEADIVNLDAEDLYLAGRLYGLEPFVVEEYNGNIYKHRSGVLIPRNSDINTISDLKNRKACLDAYGQDAGWDIPIGLLLATDTLVPDCRGELHSVEQFFGQSCAAGKWSNDSYLDQELKKRHSSLCSLCKDPTTCSSSDPYAGEEGTIKCLLEGQGQVAFTTIEAAENYFRQRPEEKDNYQFLCLDGSRMPITRRACEWARRPTNTFVIRRGKARQKEIYLRYLQQIFFRFSQLRPSWFTQSFVSSENVTQLVSVPFNMQQWDKYLGNYIPSIEKPLPGCERKNLTFCLTSSKELAKCLDLQKAAFARRIRPQIRCHSADSRKACIDAVNNRKADIITLDSGHFYHASRYEFLLPIATEVTDNPEYSVAVVRSDSMITSMAELKGQRSCHTGFGQMPGWIVPVGALVQDGVVPNENCNRAQEVAQFFSASCVPGAADARINSNGTGVENLCSQCIGDDNGNHACEMSTAERFNGEEGAFRCLVEGRGDVAFLSHQTAIQFTDGKSSKPWAKNLRSIDYRLLCRKHNNQNMNQNPNNPMNGNPNSINTNRFGRNSFLLPITEYKKCFIAMIPSPIIATSSSTSEELRFDALKLVTELSDIFTNRVPNSFKLFGKYKNDSDLIFSDRTTQIQSLPPETTYAEALGEFLPLLEDNDPVVCANTAFNSVHSYQLYMFFISFLLHFMIVYVIC